MADPAVKLTKDEREFINEMEVEPRAAGSWTHFDPPFQRKAYEKFVRRGMLEYDGDGQDRRFQWTDKGRALLDALKDEGEVSHGAS